VTSLQVEEIRQLVRGGQSQQSVANKYGITQPQVSRIIRGKQWG
jgi:predicted transcriptional regulator